MKTALNTNPEPMDPATARRLASIRQDAQPLVRSSERLARIVTLDALLAQLRDSSSVTVSMRTGNA